VTETTLSGAAKELGEILVESELITAEQLEKALELQRQDSGELSDILLKQGVITQDDLVTTTSLRLGIPVIDLKRQKAQPKAIDLIPGTLARKYNVLPLEIVDNCLVLVMANPEDSLAYRDAQSVSGKIIEPVIAAPDDIRQAINRSYRDTSEITTDIQQAVPAHTQPTTEELLQKAGERPLVRAIIQMISKAVDDRASDIHIQPRKDELRIRYRIDGVLHEVQSFPLGVHPIIISQLKVLAKMNIAEQKRPQDGHFTIKVGGEDIDIRMATYNTVLGETAVLRLLNRAFTFLKLNELGFNPWSLGRYQHLLQAPFGMIIAAGPTGSGKTTTLYASINHLNREERNIVTIEDPPEYEFDGVNQGQVNPKAGVTYAASVRATLRLDPDIVMIGEIRDRETAEMAIQAALTGRLVLSSMHANDAARALYRLLDLGVEPSLISAGLVGVVAQRIVRRVCHHCRRPLPPTQNEQDAYEREMNEVLDHFQHGEGCNFCVNTGYLGRVGLFEVMLVSDDIQRMLVKEASPQQIEAQAIKEGMIPMRTDGMIKVKEGITTPSEVLQSVFSFDSWLKAQPHRRTRPRRPSKKA